MLTTFIPKKSYIEPSLSESPSFSLATAIFKWKRGTQEHDKYQHSRLSSFPARNQETNKSCPSCYGPVRQKLVSITIRKGRDTSYPIETEAACYKIVRVTCIQRAVSYAPTPGGVQNLRGRPLCCLSYTTVNTRSQTLPRTSDTD